MKGFISEELLKFNKKAFCTRCDRNDTSKSGKFGTRPKGSLSDQPSMAQIKYIRYLGGDPGRVKTKGDVNEYIAKLKKEQEK